MMKNVLIALSLILALAAAHGDHGHGHDHDHDHDGPDPNSHVLVLTGATFDEEIAKHDHTLVEFYAPWCGHCKRLAPEYEKAAHDLEGRGSLAKVDCTAEATLCSKFEVRGYPTVKIFTKDGKHSEYPGARTADAIVKFMDKQSAPPYTALVSAEALAEFVGKDDSEVSVVGFFASASGKDYDTFLATAKSLRNDYNFGVVSTSDARALAGSSGASGLPAVIVFKPKSYGEENAVYQGEMAEEPLAEFFGGESFPLMGEIGPENYQSYLERELPLVWFFLELDTQVTKELTAAARQVAANFKGQLSFVHLDGIKWADHAKNFGVKGKPPGMVIEDRDTGKNYVYPTGGALTAEALQAWVQKFVDGSLEPTVKTQEIPEKNDGPVKVVVGKSFQDIVMDDSKDVFVEFYAPWCGHCKSLAPKYEKLGEMFAKDTNVVIAKVDATENDTPAQIKGFPTLILYAAGHKANPVTYQGERTEQAMADWLRQHATTLGGSPAAASHDHEDL